MNRTTEPGFVRQRVTVSLDDLIENDLSWLNGYVAEEITGLQSGLCA